MQGILTGLLAVVGLLVSIIVARAQYQQTAKKAFREELNALKGEINECKRMGREYEVTIREMKHREGELSRENDRLRAELSEVLTVLYRAGLLPDRRRTLLDPPTETP